MKKVINVLNGMNILSLSTFFVVSCDWKVPPLTVEQLDHIFSTVNQQVTSKEEIPKFDIPLTMPWNYDENEQNIEKARIWADSITSTFSSTLATKDTGYINKGLNIVDGTEDSNYFNEKLNITQETLNYMQSYYFTIRISDILATQTGNWLSEQEYNNQTVKKTPIKINSKQVEIQENNKPSEYSEEYYSAIDIESIWALGNEEMVSTQYNVRFLFSFSPTETFNVDPTVFYIDVEMTR